MWGRTVRLERFEVRFRDSQGREVDNATDGKPYLDLALVSAVDGSERQVLGMVDTGAQFNALSPKLIGELGFRLVGSATTITGSHAVETTKHWGAIRIGGFAINTGFTGIDLEGAGNAFALVLGCDFLNLGVLHMDFPRGEHWFQLAHP